jgi:oxidase EvaA
MRVATSLAQLRDTLDKSKVGFELMRVRRAQAAPHWDVTDGALQHSSRGFFSVNGIEIERKQRVLFYQPQGAVTGHLTATHNGERVYLLQARAEPGCLGQAQFGPTIQSTPANYMRLHGGQTTPYASGFVTFEPQTHIVDDTSQLDLGERYYFKTKRCILAETSAPHEAEGPYIWASRDAVRAAAACSAFLNIDLRSILAIEHWSSDPSTGELSPCDASVLLSLDAPVRPNIMGALAACLIAPPRSSRFLAIESLQNWRVTEWGLEEGDTDQGFRVDFFHVKAAMREVREWVQPLINSADVGRVVLACRERGGVAEFLVRAAPESGLATGAALAPTYVRYPGTADEEPDWLRQISNEPWVATTESDEGGRFYQDASHYEIIKVASDHDLSDANSAWLTLSEIKAFLRMSNVCSIQLRGVISLLLAV